MWNLEIADMSKNLFVDTVEQQLPCRLVCPETSLAQRQLCAHLFSFDPQGIERVCEIDNLDVCRADIGP